MSKTIKQFIAVFAITSLFLLALVLIVTTKRSSYPEETPEQMVVTSGSSSKRFSTNFTIVNFGSTDAATNVNFWLENGLDWTGKPSASGIIASNGSWQLRQYAPFETAMVSGKGSVQIASNQPEGAVAQILARNQSPTTSGAYSGFLSGSTNFYVPLVSRNGNSATGIVNSQIIVQNTENNQISSTIHLYDLYTGDLKFTKNNSIPANGIWFYDLADESSLPSGFFGSAVVSSGNKITVVSNMFNGPDSLQTFNAFPGEDIATAWATPLITARLPNGLNTPVTVQNVSGNTIAANQITLDCVGAIGTVPANLVIRNSTQVVNNGSYVFNPVTDTVNFPTGWVGGCRVSAPSNVVTFVQMRFLAGNTANAAAYEGIKASSTGKKVVVPLVAKRLPNGFATVVSIQNLSTSAVANATFSYTRSSECLGVGSPTYEIYVTIPSKGSLSHNHRITSGADAVGQIPDGWCGSLHVTADQPIGGIVQMTNINNPPGDTFMAHNAFILP